MGQESSLDKLFRKVYKVLKETQTPYLLIGGLAAGVLGEPRFTRNADFLIFIPRNRLGKFLKCAKENGLRFSKEKVERTVLERGVFRVFLGDYHADFIINALKIGKSALGRRVEIKFFGRKVSFPTPEDLILFKLMAGRELDLIDVKRIFLRHQERLDRKYLENWAMQICDEAEDMKVWNRLQKIIKEGEKVTG